FRMKLRSALRGLPQGHPRSQPHPALRWLPVVVCFFVAFTVARSSRADNAGFALAPKSSTFAFDARGLSELLGRENATSIRPIVEAVAGRDALLTFDALARRCNAGSDTVAREVFAGRIAFALVDLEVSDRDGANTANNAENNAGRENPNSNPNSPNGNAQLVSSWIFGIQADDDRCERVLQMLGARLRGPGYFEAPTEGLHARRVGGWLLIAPTTGADVILDQAAKRIAVEDSESSLLGEPLAQHLLVSDAPLRVFIRHDAPIGGATVIGIRPNPLAGRAGLQAEIEGRYDDSPIGEPGKKHALDGTLMRAFEERAVFAIANPADGVPDPSDAFWLAIIPELRPSPSMRANLAGERLLVVGASSRAAAPALAVAWRVDDSIQAERDQRLQMRGVLCGLARATEQGASTPHGVDGTVHPDPRIEPKRQAPTTDDATSEHTGTALGPFFDRYLGKSFKLGACVLCWSTVRTPCGGWQVYASDTEWLGDVSERLERSSCSEDGKTTAGGIGFCDGPRAASVLRRWRPLASNDPNDRVGRGIDALAATIEQLGRLRFAYESPAPGRLMAKIDLEPLGTLQSPRPASGTSTNSR
ncbi:MAG: hypothetical protein RIR10_1366, partial [Planctomycetota bacterium]